VIFCFKADQTKNGTTQSEELNIGFFDILKGVGVTEPRGVTEPKGVGVTEPRFFERSWGYRTKRSLDRELTARPWVSERFFQGTTGVEFHLQNETKRKTFFC